MSEITPTTLQEIIYSGLPSVNVAELDSTDFVPPEVDEKKISPEMASFYLLRVFPRIADFQRVFSTEFCKYFRFCD
ncbi:hypothetical protein KC921_03055, partial [Candidatus Woesebacteria bacterium]|nr:hypothetical protein [Candidatus Woesebacteria bacterium]